MKKVVLNLDDFSPVNNHLDLLLRLKEYYPNFKVSMFTVPIDIKTDWGAYCNRDKYLKKIKENLDWIQIIPHGLTHYSSREMKDCSAEEFKNEIIPRITQAFAEDGLPFVKGFKAPHWKWSDGVVDALDDEGWFGAILREPGMLETQKFYQYNHLINEPFWESDLEVLKLHGHIYGTKNDFEDCFDNLLKLPLDTQWYYVTDFIEELKDD